MIKRILQVKNIGAFRDFSNGGSVQFEELTFVYGLNTRGKTTITDVFSSLRGNNTELIEERKSIPDNGAGQSVKISLKPDDQSGEELFEFSNEQWSKVPSQEFLHIFGSEFIHRNLFTGLSVERTNKENLTQFILGQEGVELANQIAEDKRLLRQKKNSLRELIPAYVKKGDEEQIQAFLEIDPDTINVPETQEELDLLREKLKQEQQRLEKPSEILSIPEFPEISIPLNVAEELITRTNTVLSREYQEISSSALEHIQQHIDQNFAQKENAERWIKEGLDTKSEASEACVFCGQNLSNVTDLMEAYHSYFNKAYREFISEILGTIDRLERDWRNLSYNKLSQLTSRHALLAQYQKLISGEEFDELVSEFIRITESIPEDRLNELIKASNTQLIDCLDQKKQKPHESVDAPDFLELTEVNSSYFNKLTELAGIVTSIRQVIEEFKEEYRNLTEIRERISNLQSDIKLKERKVARVHQNEECLAYKEHSDEIDTIQERISTNEENLRSNQSRYLEDFYEKINYHFQRFGSNNFTLERKTDNRGHQPVYYLKVKFRDTEISESNFSKVFSESDKRALALAVFWSKIDLLDEEQKSQAIIILDDPVTSFDDNRILMSLNLFKETLPNVRQIVILTHYKHFIRNFCERSLNDDFTTAFIEIGRNDQTSLLKRIQSHQFTETPYERMFNKINSFIERESDQDIRGDLRPFLESQYLPHFYIDKLKQARKNGVPCSTLSEKIDAIFDDNQEAKTKFHQLRTALNPDSHIFTSSNEEDIRNFARDMMSYLYDFEYV